MSNSPENLSEAPQASESKPANARFYEPGLDAVRFLAFLLVYIHHTIPRFPSANHSWKFNWVVTSFADLCGFGLPLFFVLSAFLISRLLDLEKQTSGNIDIRKFYERRILRIWPLYFLGIAIGFVNAWHTSSPNGFFIASIFMFGNIYASMQGSFGAAFGPQSNVMSHLWSISVEEQFYLVYPSIAKFMQVKHRLLFCVGLLVLSDISIVALFHHGYSADFGIWFNSLAQFQMFAFGIVFATKAGGIAFKALKQSRQALLVALTAVSWITAAFVLHIKSLWILPSVFGIVLGYFLIGLGAIGIVALGLSLSERQVPKSIRYLGKISYGLYVFHLLAKNIASTYFSFGGGAVSSVLRNAIGFLLTIGFAALSYKLLETPFLKLKSRLEVIRSRPV